MQPTRLRFLALPSLVVALVVPRLVLGESDPDLDAAVRRHITQSAKPAPMPGSEMPDKSKKPDPTVSAEAMVNHLTNDIPADLNVAVRRPQVDLDIKFDFDSAELSADGMQQLNITGQALNDPRLQGRRFMLAGHTDDRGDAAYNRALSQRRAASARVYLIEMQGVSPDRLETAGFGSEHPKDQTETPEARKHNRRVVLEMIE